MRSLPRLWTLAPLAAFALFGFRSSPAAADCQALARCELVWADEFDGSQVDSDNWVFQLGDGSEVGLPSGWGNNERQYYQRENATVADGVLTITARAESISGFSYTSARLRTAGLADWRYGRFEMRARLPIGKGIWPAFWMLPAEEAYGGWAASGEIDIMEYIGSEPSRVFGTLHYGQPWPNNSFSGREYDLSGETFADDFHVFAIEWQPGEIRWYVDDLHYATQTDWFSSGGPYPAPFDRSFYLLLNLAVGGNLPGAPDSTTEFPQELVVDYVRVYQSGAAKGTQVSTIGLSFDKPERLKKIDAVVSIPFENQARKTDRASDPRSLACALEARGTAKALSVKGKLLMRLTGSIAGAAWSGRPVQSKLDRQGAAAFGADVTAELVQEAAGEGATIEAFQVAFDGAGGKKVERLDIDCWQLAADD